MPLLAIPWTLPDVVSTVQKSWLDGVCAAERRT
jgi:hypothetical protein